MAEQDRQDIVTLFNTDTPRPPGLTCGCQQNPCKSKKSRCWFNYLFLLINRLKSLSSGF